MPNKNTHILAAFSQLQREPKSVVLATIIETFGSTYQKAGARMLITQEGELLGLLGGGCFERDLAEHARQVFADGIPKTVFYDMRAPEDVIWGLGLGCNGAVRVLLQLLQSTEHFSPLNIIAESAEQQHSGVLITIYESIHPDFPAGRNLFLPASNIEHQQLLDSAPFPFTHAALKTFQQQQPRLESHRINEFEILTFYEPINPPLKLLILGAGPDAQPLAQCANTLGWQVSVLDYRPAQLKPERFPHVKHLAHCIPEELGVSYDLNRFSAVLLMTHNMDSDQRYLKALCFSQIPFIGLLGPATRRDRLLASLGNDAQAISGQVFGPIGLDIGAETPEEIALSIMAGIHAALQKRGGAQLSPPVSTCHYERRQR